MNYSKDRDWNSIRGGYVEACAKRGYATEALASSALRLAKSKGRTERSFYKCSRCSMFHLSSRESATNYVLQASTVIQSGATSIAVGRKVKATETVIGVSITFTKDGVERSAVCNLAPDQARAVLDALIEALYDNVDPAPESC